jgi:hypothetical protein
VDGEAPFEFRRPVHFSRDQQGAVEQERGLLLLDDLEPGAPEGRLAGRGQLEGLTAGDGDAAASPELGVDDHRQVRAAEGVDQTVQAGGMVEVAVAEDDGLQVFGREAHPPHVLHESIRHGTRVVEDAALLDALPDGDQQREPMLRSRRVKRLATFQERGRYAGRLTAAEAETFRRPLVLEKRVGHVVDEGGDGN